MSDAYLNLSEDFVQECIKRAMDQPKAGNVQVLGLECFRTDNIISYKGENYFRACDVLVKVWPGGEQTHCVKRVGHPSVDHEDYYGNTVSRTPYELKQLLRILDEEGLDGL